MATNQITSSCDFPLLLLLYLNGYLTIAIKWIVRAHHKIAWKRQKIWWTFTNIDCKKNACSFGSFSGRVNKIQLIIVLWLFHNLKMKFIFISCMGFLFCVFGFWHSLFMLFMTSNEWMNEHMLTINVCRFWYSLKVFCCALLLFIFLFHCWIFICIYVSEYIRFVIRRASVWGPFCVSAHNVYDRSYFDNWCFFSSSLWQQE